MSTIMIRDHEHTSSATGGNMGGLNKLNVTSPFRLPALKTLSKEQLDEKLDPLLEATTEELLMLREKTYAVLDRMDELESSGQKIPVVEFEEILRGAAVIEQFLAERMQGVMRAKGGKIINKAEVI
ncbi:MAG: hypothetical protein EYC62_02150 [Alphaproteobacteria bacterium]|nr:MAG: hypothetical protein EYC62_02150 [Alphaproteobacteria bacterium]